MLVSTLNFNPILCLNSCSDFLFVVIFISIIYVNFKFFKMLYVLRALGRLEFSLKEWFVGGREDPIALSDSTMFSLRLEKDEYGSQDLYVRLIYLCCSSVF